MMELQRILRFVPDSVVNVASCSNPSVSVQDVGNFSKTKSGAYYDQDK